MHLANTCNKSFFDKQREKKIVANKPVSHLISTTDLLHWRQRYKDCDYFNGKYADFAGTDDVTIPYSSHSLFTCHQILRSGDRIYHTKIFFYLIAYFTKVKETGVSWPFLDYFDLPKMKSFVQRYNKVVKF